MSLREEIEQFLDNVEDPKATDKTKIIMWLIEKRIDSFIEQSKKRQNQRRKDPDTDKFYEGWFASIEYFKERLKADV